MFVMCQNDHQASDSDHNSEESTHVVSPNLDVNTLNTVDDLHKIV